jgi:glutaminyl-tRNA synthetase
MRFDDTNPEKEEQEFVDGILDAVHWLGYHWGANDENLYHASDYFDWMYEFAVELIKHGDAYVDSQTAEEMRATRGSLTEHGIESPYRSRPIAENLRLFSEMREGHYPDGAHVLRARIDMKSPNINMRDPALYRIKNAEHHRTGAKWHIYPMYTYAHPIEDALENITHSLCTLEFEDQRPFYDWVLDKIAQFGMLQRPLPQQIEFSRLNSTYHGDEQAVPEAARRGEARRWLGRPAHADARRCAPPRLSARGDTVVRRSRRRVQGGLGGSIPVLEDAQREVLNETAPRRIAVLDPSSS